MKAGEYATLVDDGDAESNSKFSKNKGICLLVTILVIAIYSFFIYTAIHDAKDPIDMVAFKKDFQVFLYAISDAYDPNYLQIAQDLNDKYDYFLSELALAMAYQMMNSTNDANNWLNSAQDDKDDDYEDLLPTADEFENKVPLQGVYPVADQIWAVSDYFVENENQMFSTFQTGYLVKLSNGSLVFINPVLLDLTLQDTITSTIGTVDFLIEQNRYRSLNLDQIQSQWPDASTYGVQSSEGGNFDGFLMENDDIFPGELVFHYLNGTDSDECAILHLDSNTLFLTDTLYLSDADQNVVGTITNTTSFLNRLYYFTVDVYDQLGVPSSLNVTDSAQFSASIRLVESLNYTRVLLGSGGQVASDARNKVQDAFSGHL